MTSPRSSIAQTFRHAGNCGECASTLPSVLHPERSAPMLDKLRMLLLGQVPGVTMSEFGNRSRSSAHRRDYIWQYEYYDDEEPVSFEGLRANRCEENGH